jgi:formylglycine-generating enzyme required for sulfatase activity
MERRARETELQALLASGVLPTVPRLRVALTRRTFLELALIPAGTFLMGSKDDEELSDDETPRHAVTLTRPFWLGIYPVTQSQWRAIMGSNPSRSKKPDQPVEQVSWIRCQSFCEKAREKTGWRFRLPTEAEWEYACRAGTTTPFHFGTSACSRQASFNGDVPYGGGEKGASAGVPCPVGQYTPNAWGLYDMHGQVWEWCQDWYANSFYKVSRKKDPVGPRTGQHRVIRGGGCAAVGRRCRASARGSALADQFYESWGFRVAL